MIRNGFFGFQDYLKALCDAVDGEGGDHYLIGKDFIPYLEAQVFSFSQYKRFLWELASTFFLYYDVFVNVSYLS